MLSILCVTDHFACLIFKQKKKFFLSYIFVQLNGILIMIALKINSHF